MKSNLEMHQRRSIRLRGYDYSQPGAYFVTICTQRKQCMFGRVVDEGVHLNDAGRMVKRVWEDLSQRFHTVELDQFVVMPNHIHGVIIIKGVGATLVVAQYRAGTRPAPTIQLGDVVAAFKSNTTDEYINGVKQHYWSPFANRLWQRNYYERVIRDETELDRIRQYIIENPLKWALDPENPEGQSNKPEEPWQV